MRETAASFEVRNARSDELPAQSLPASEGWMREAASVGFERKLCFGFEPARPGKLMEIVRLDPYRTAPAAD